MKDSSCVFEIIYQTIRSDKEHLSVSELCKIAGVSRSGYYAWVKAAPIRERQEEEDPGRLRTDPDCLQDAWLHKRRKGHLHGTDAYGSTDYYESEKDSSFDG